MTTFRRLVMFVKWGDKHPSLAHLHKRHQAVWSLNDEDLEVISTPDQ
jgi:hypothetical protein